MVKMSMSINLAALTQDLLNHRGVGMTPPSEQSDAFSFKDAYRVATRLMQHHAQQGAKLIGRKVGISNKAAWEKMGLDNVVWGYMLDDTVTLLPNNSSRLSLAGTSAPRIEPEIVFKLREPPPIDFDPVELLRYVEWMGLGFEVVDCPYPDWKFKPVDLVATYGFHAALVVGELLEPDPLQLAELAYALSETQVTLYKNGEVAAEGSGKNVVDNPVLSLAHLAQAVLDQPDTPPLQAREIISTGTLTTAVRIEPGDVIEAEVSGLGLPRLRLELTS